MELFVPGRICLFGEHSDWAGGYRRVNPQLEKGYTLISGTQQGLYARVAPHPDSLILSSVTSEGNRHGPFSLPMSSEDLLAEAQAGGFWSYLAGVAFQADLHHRVGGLVIDNYKTDLPVKKGLSSSAAISVLAARAFNRLYDLKLSVRGEMELAYQGEITTPSRCGRMDQGCAFGDQPVLMTFDGDLLHTKPLEIGGAVHLVIVDLNAHKDTHRILACLNEAFPLARDDLQEGVQALFGEHNRHIVHQAVAALRAGDAPRLGSLMNEAQALFDRYAVPACPEELTAPVLHRLLAHPPLQAHIWGGKGVGSQGDGSAQLVVRGEAAQQTVLEIVTRDLGMTGWPLTLRRAQAARISIPVLNRGDPATRTAGPGPARFRVGTAVIPAAGLGTRLFPATKAVKKELFPIIDPHGTARPALQLIVEEALSTGVERVILIVRPEDRVALQDYFTRPSAPEASGRLPAAAQVQAQRLVEIGSRISFVTQAQQEGFGHAVLCARQAVGEDPFLLLLGDHLYRAAGQISCASQLVAAAQQRSSSVIGLQRTPVELSGHYGAAAGHWLDQGLLQLTALVEKPGADYVRQHLQVPNLPASQVLTFFGQYVLTPAIFDDLEALIGEGERQAGEFQLTPALERLRASQGCLGLLVEGQSFDIGRPQAYLQALNAFQQGSA